MGVVIRRWVWLETIGVVSGCFPHITYAPINVSPHLPPPGAGWRIFLVWNGRLAPGVGILNR